MGTVYEDQYTFIIKCGSVLLRTINVFKKLLRKSKHILCSVTFYRKSCCLWDNVEKYCRDWQTTGGNMAYSQCMMDSWDFRHTLRICNTYCFSNATMVTRTRLNATLYIFCLSCYSTYKDLSLSRCDLTWPWRPRLNPIVLTEDSFPDEVAPRQVLP